MQRLVYLSTLCFAASKMFNRNANRYTHKNKHKHLNQKQVKNYRGREYFRSIVDNLKCKMQCRTIYQDKLKSVFSCIGPFRMQRKLSMNSFALENNTEIHLTFKSQSWA